MHVVAVFFCARTADRNLREFALQRFASAAPANPSPTCFLSSFRTDLFSLNYYLFSHTCAFCADPAFICRLSLDHAHLHKHKAAETETCKVNIPPLCCRLDSLSCAPQLCLFIFMCVCMCACPCVCVCQRRTYLFFFYHIPIVITQDLFVIPWNI